MTASLALKPTDQQDNIVDAAGAGKSFKIYASAGTGKTKTLELIAYRVESSLYIAFGHNDAVSARRRFPPNCRVVTAHALGFEAVGRAFKHRLAKSIWALKRSFLERAGRHYYRQTDEALATLTAFLSSADREIGPGHAPSSSRDAEEAAYVAETMWQWAIDENDTFPIIHDVYLKLWQVRGATLPPGVVRLVDEAQDLSAVMLAIVAQDQEREQTIYVGDPYQQIYGWRGAVNALQSIELPAFPLTQSWRFGPLVADVANAILATRHAPFKVQGMTSSTVGIGAPEGATGVIARTNSGLIEAAWAAARDGRKIHVFGGVGDLTGLLESALELYTGGRPRNEPFSMFSSWDELAEAVEQSSAASEFRPIVKLVDEYTTGITEVCSALRMAQRERPEEADISFGTAHKFKGQETARLYCADDYKPYAGYRQKASRYVLNEEQANVMYVTVTRAQQKLTMSPGFANALASSLRDSEKYWEQQRRPQPISGVEIFAGVLAKMAAANGQLDGVA